MTETRNTPSKGGAPRASARPLSQHALTFTEARLLIEQGLGCSSQDAAQMLREARGGRIRSFYSVGSQNWLEIPFGQERALERMSDPQLDHYILKDVERFIRDQRLRLEGAAGQKEQVPAPEDQGDPKLRSRLEKVTSQNERASAPKKKRGPPFQYKWAKIGAAFGTWLHEDLRHPKLEFPDHYKVVCDLTAELGHKNTPDQETVRHYIEEWLEGHKEALIFIERRKKEA